MSTFFIWWLCLAGVGEWILEGLTVFGLIDYRVPASPGMSVALLALARVLYVLDRKADR